MNSDTNIFWQSYIYKTECDGWIRMYDGGNWILVEEYIDGDFVWIHRELVSDGHSFRPRLLDEPS